MPLRKYPSPEEAKAARLQQMRTYNQSYVRTDEQKAADNKAKRERYAACPLYRAEKLAKVKAHRSKARQTETA
jgi:hypothetical protein